MIHQLQYRFKTRPTRADIDGARALWLAGLPLPAGVEVRPISWTRDKTRSARKAALRGYVGRAGIVKLYGKPNLTLCDYDSGEWSPPYPLICRIARMLDIVPVWSRYDRTEHGWHLVIQWNRSFTPLEIIAIQAVLGSDRKREAYNLARVFSGKASNARWNLLFEYKIT